MPYKLDVEIDLKIDDKTRYFISSHHRRKGKSNPEKCVWVISHQEEIECFKMTKSQDWISENVGWGLKLKEKTIQVVGINQGREELKIAKFIDSSKNDLWHGYPADYLNKHQDIPHMKILQLWEKEKILEKHHVRKIKQGIPCNL